MEVDILGGSYASGVNFYFPNGSEELQGGRKEGPRWLQCWSITFRPYNVDLGAAETG